MRPSQIFISYQSRDYEIACRLYDRLLSDRYWVWIDKKNLEPAKRWEPQIEKNLRKSKTLIALVSSNSVGSDWVKHEGSMAYGRNQLIIPAQIEPFGNYSPNQLPIWVAPIQLLPLLEGSQEYDNQFQSLKQLLGEPLPIRQHLKESLIHYRYSGVLLDEVALSLIERHYDELHLTKEEKEVADRLIGESKRKLDEYWENYAKLEKDYKDARDTIYRLNQSFDNKVDSLNEIIETLNKEIEALKNRIESDARIQLVIFVVIFFAITFYAFGWLIYFLTN